VNVAFHFDDRRASRRPIRETSSLSEVLAALRPSLRRGREVEVRVGHLTLTSLAMRESPTNDPYTRVLHFDPDRFQHVRRLWLTTLVDGWFAMEDIAATEVEPDDIYVVSCFGIAARAAHVTAESLRRGRRFLFAAETIATNPLSNYLYRDSLFPVLHLESSHRAWILTEELPGNERILEQWLRNSGFKSIHYRFFVDADDDLINMVLAHLAEARGANCGES
jgi:hypothetical protein